MMLLNRLLAGRSEATWQCFSHVLRHVPAMTPAVINLLSKMTESSDALGGTDNDDDEDTAMDGNGADGSEKSSKQQKNKKKSLQEDEDEDDEDEGIQIELGEAGASSNGAGSTAAGPSSGISGLLSLSDSRVDDGADLQRKLGLSCFRDIILYSPPWREECLNRVLQYATSSVKGGRVLFFRGVREGFG